MRLEIMVPTMTIQETLQSKLTDALSPIHLEVINESRNHNVPPGSESHFKVVIVSRHFEGKRLLARHRAINSILADELKNGVHALSLHTTTPAEWEARNGAVANSPPCLGGSKN